MAQLFRASTVWAHDRIQLTRNVGEGITIIKSNTEATATVRLPLR